MVRIRPLGRAKLPWPAYFGNQEFVDFLLDNGADFDSTEGKGILILRNAAQYGLERLFRVVSERDKASFGDEERRPCAG